MKQLRTTIKYCGATYLVDYIEGNYFVHPVVDGVVCKSMPLMSLDSELLGVVLDRVAELAHLMEI